MPSACVVELASQRMYVRAGWPVHVPESEMASYDHVWTHGACRSERQSSLPDSLGAGEAFWLLAALLSPHRDLAGRAERTAHLSLVLRRRLAWTVPSTTPQPWQLCLCPSTLPGTPWLSRQTQPSRSCWPRPTCLPRQAALFAC